MIMIVILLIGLLIFTFDLTMVLVATFKRQLLWGLATITFLVIYPVYAIINWSNAQVCNGFLISIAGALIVLAAVYGEVARDLPFTGAQALADKLPIALPADDSLPTAPVAGAGVPRMNLPHASQRDR